MPKKETCGLHGPPQSKLAVLSMYIEAALVDHLPDSLTVSKRRRRKPRRTQQTKVQANVSTAPGLVPPISTPTPALTKPKRRKRTLKVKSSALQSRDAQCGAAFVVRNLVTAEDLEDEDEALEVQEEVLADFQRFGEVVDLEVVKREEGERKMGDVVVQYRDDASAMEASKNFDNKMFGGKTIECRWETRKTETLVKAVVVTGMVALEELEDPDEAEDVKEELLQELAKYGEVMEMQIDEKTGEITVKFNKAVNADEVAEKMSQSKYGGQTVTAQTVTPAMVPGESKDAVSKSEAKCNLPSDIQMIKSPETQEVFKTFLKRLAQLQERAHTQRPQHDKRSRRLVLGLHEVRRGLACSKLRLLLIASDLEAAGLLNDKVIELVTMATEQQVPIVAPLNRRKLGRALNKSVRVSCVGVYSFEGANERFQQILNVIRTPSCQQ